MKMWMEGNNCIGCILNDLSVVLLQLLYYLLFATPGPLAGILDFYILGPLGNLLQKRWRTGDFTIRDRWVSTRSEAVCRIQYQLPVLFALLDCVVRVPSDTVWRDAKMTGKNLSPKCTSKCQEHLSMVLGLYLAYVAVMLGGS